MPPKRKSTKDAEVEPDPVAPAPAATTTTTTTKNATTKKAKPNTAPPAASDVPVVLPTTSAPTATANTSYHTIVQAANKGSDPMAKPKPTANLFPKQTYGVRDIYCHLLKYDIDPRESDYDREVMREINRHVKEYVNYVIMLETAGEWIEKQKAESVAFQKAMTATPPTDYVWPYEATEGSMVYCPECDVMVGDGVAEHCDQASHTHHPLCYCKHCVHHVKRVGKWLAGQVDKLDQWGVVQEEKEYRAMGLDSDEDDDEDDDDFDCGW